MAPRSSPPTPGRRWRRPIDPPRRCSRRPSISMPCAVTARPGAYSATGVPIFTIRCYRSTAVPEACELPNELVFVDLETTVGSALRDRRTEVGIVRVQDGATIEEWSTLVNPECRIPAYIESFTGITNEMVASAPRFGEIGDLVL